MSDIFREVEEDLRQDNYKKIWDQWGSTIIAAVVLIVGGTAGYQLWQGYQTSQRMDYARQYIEASELDRGDQQEKALSAFTALAESGSLGYQSLATFRRAGILGDQGKIDEAIVLFDEIAADPAVDSSFRRLAEIKAAVLLAETAPYADIRDRVVSLAESQTPWRFSALEILGYAAYKHNDNARAIQSFQRLADDPETPISIRTRATEMLILLDAPKKELSSPPVSIDGPADNTSESGASE